MKSFLKEYKTTIGSLLLSLILFGFIFFFVEPLEILAGFKRLSWWKYLIILGISTITQLATATRWHLVLHSLDIKPKFTTTFFSRLAGHAVSFVTPVAEFGGAPARAYCIKNEQNASFGRSLTSAIIDNLLELIVQMIFISGTLFYFVLRFSLPAKLELIITLIFIFGIGVFIFSFRMLIGKSVLKSFFNFLESLIRGESKTISFLRKKIIKGEGIMIDFFSNNKKVFIQTILLGFLTYLSSAFEIFVLTRLMGFQFTILQVLLIKVILNVAFIFPLPAGLGASEWLQAGYFGLIGATGGAGIAFSLLFKSVNAVWALVGVMLLAYRGLLGIRELAEASGKQESTKTLH